MLSCLVWLFGMSGIALPQTVRFNSNRSSQLGIHGTVVPPACDPSYYEKRDFLRIFRVDHFRDARRIRLLARSGRPISHHGGKQIIHGERLGRREGFARTCPGCRPGNRCRRANARGNIRLVCKLSLVTKD